MSAARRHAGGCLCGAVRYEAEGDPTFVNHCHCVQCQKASGAAFATWATWPLDRVRLLGDPPRHFESSPGIQRSFCATCGGTLFWRRLDRRPATLDIAAGSLDAPDVLAPSMHIFVKSRRRWVVLDDRLPSHAEFPPRL
jgi:hypothetical protein